MVLEPHLFAPLAVGDRVGTIKLGLDDETVFQAPVVALETVEEGGFFSRLWDTILMWIFSLFTA